MGAPGAARPSNWLSEAVCSANTRRGHCEVRKLTAKAQLTIKKNKGRIWTFGIEVRRRCGLKFNSVPATCFRFDICLTVLTRCPPHLVALQYQWNSVAALVALKWLSGTITMADYYHFVPQIWQCSDSMTHAKGLQKKEKKKRYKSTIKNPHWIYSQCQLLSSLEKNLVKFKFKVNLMLIRVPPTNKNIFLDLKSWRLCAGFRLLDCAPLHPIYWKLPC